MKKLLGILGATAAVFILAIAPAATSTQAASKAVTAELNKKGTLQIGLEGTYQPYGYHEDGKLTGYEVEVGKAVAKKLNLKPVFVETQFDSLIAGLNVNKYDLVLNNMAVTKQRQAKYRFTTPYIYSKSELVVKKGNKDIKKITDIKGKKMAQTASSNNAADAKRLGASIVSSSGFEQSIELVDQGRADGTINSVEAVGAYLKQKPNAKITQIAGGSKLETQKIAGMMNKKDKNLNKSVNKALAGLRKDGTLKKLSQKYFGTDVTNK
ncbi:transporter substrate-binding domain-containing protein [Loigolactobacillus zhaoyuanensis]|uniref:Transporter substrate-binding domain-containing protein n=1 Tax=Loigolactobacillus zhaoyuanensis TaxID=2486017 RepID=A0ABW8UEE8_9LACO|nr:transporter substrate-binding domain-containing protein [Loigolactobacillus zhaoyuanensis]